jgi:hypothetical protein
MRFTNVKEQTGVETKVSTPYDVASHLAYSKGFLTLKEYTDYVVSNKMTGFLPDPTKYPQYTSAWNFLGTSRTQYYKNRCEIIASKRNQEEINRKRAVTLARNKAEREAKAKLAEANIKVSTKVVHPESFTSEDVIDILIKSDANVDYIAEFIKTHNVSDAYAVKVLLNLLKSKSQVAVTL